MQRFSHIIPRKRQPRRGFTLVELLIVIVVIGILVALLVPAIGTAVNRAREAEVVTEMSTFDSGLVNFRSKYGVDVPSFVVLYETGASWDPTNPVGAVADVSHRASRAFIRQAWPDFDFSLDQDINGDNDAADVLVLNGPECLAFFLGGVCETNIVDNNGALKAGATAGAPITWWNPLGFSANPQRPFARGGNRVQPFANLDGGPTGRFRDTFTATDEYMPEYLDPLPNQTSPYLYFSSYGGRGYQPSGPDGTAGNADDELAGVNNIYYSNSALTTPQNPQTHQLISPGSDTDYGTGGEYNGSNVPSTPGRTVERDNITNFKNGRLG